MPWLRRRHLLLLAAIIPLAILVLAAAFGAAWLTAPNVGDLAARLRSIERADGSRPVKLQAVAPVMRQAVVATEDERFYQHGGIDVIGILRAVPYDLSHFSLAQGASTITEQLAKIVYLGGNDHSPWGKLRDAAIALHLESSYSKEQILDAYLNTVYFGSGAFGVEQASERYFGVPASRLTLGRASLLAGLIQDPTGDDPMTHPLDARQRQAEALRSMVRNGFVTIKEADHALTAPLRLAHGPPLPPLRGQDLSPGPLFDWSELALGAVGLALGVAALVAAGRQRERLGRWTRVAWRVSAVAVIIAGTLIAFAAFRTA